MSTIIDAGVTNPAQSPFATKTDKAQAWRITCTQTQGCDLYAQGTCLLKTVLQTCKFGSKTVTNGPTPRARSFGAWVRDQQSAVDDLGVSLAPLKAWNRTARINAFYHLPYANISGPAKLGFAIPNPWVLVEDMTADLLARIVGATPRYYDGRAINVYQATTIPKLLSDLRHHHPELFALLPKEAAARAQTLSAVGRKADLTTCMPGTYMFGKDAWAWDGSTLTGNRLVLAPVKGPVTITITPTPGQAVTITSDEQVGPQTVLLD